MTHDSERQKRLAKIRAKKEAYARKIRETADVIPVVKKCVAAAQQGRAMSSQAAQFFAFSTVTGQAWLLEANERACLHMRDGSAADFLGGAIKETAHQVLVEWTGNYRILEGVFYYDPISLDDVDMPRSYEGFPLAAIQAWLDRDSF